jgi:NADH-quinone oxidoreductase subunit N
MNYTQLLQWVAPEFLLTLAALGVLVIDLTTLRGAPWKERMQVGASLAVLGCLAGIAAIFLAPTTTPAGYLGATLVLNPLTSLVKVVVLVLSLSTVLLTLETRFTEHVGEYFALLLLATVGMMFLVSTENLLMLFVSLELLSLCLYIMTAFNKQNAHSAEAALKYFLFGGMAAAFLLFGLSLVYGLTGELELSRIAAKVGNAPAGARFDPLLVLALLLVVAGFGFKVAAVPFHLWAPDTYQGAPLPSAALIASGSKVASFYILAKVLLVGVGGAAGSAGWGKVSQGWVPMLALAAALSVVIGNVAAIAQTSVRRLLAYSAIAHAGYMLAGLLAADHRDGIASVLYYVTTYALTTVGAFAVVTVVQERAGDDRLSAFAGLSARAPLLSFCMMIFLLSLAGIPPLAGFFGKFYLFKAALFAPGASPQPLGLLWLIILALTMSAVSLYYYLQVLKQIYVARAPEGTPAVQTTAVNSWLVAALAAAVLVLGCFPNLLLNPLLTALN